MSSGPLVALHEVRHLPAVLLADAGSRAAIERRALRGINRMLAFARTHVPYYRGRAGYHVAPLASLAELARLPLLDKPTVLGAPVDRFHTPGLRPGRYRTDRTSGSTGTVLEVRHDADAYGYHGATLVRRLLRAGYRPWWRIAQLKGYDRPQRWFQRLGLFRRVVVPAGLPDDALAARVLAVRPHLIMGYPVLLRALLRELSDSAMARLRRTLRLIMTDSELLTAQDEASFTDGFGVPVFDEYSAYEVLTVSTQCRAGAMHVDEDRVWLEIVDPAGRPVPDGTVGSVVVTHFRERAMPLVRYQPGDRGLIEPDPCGCGRPFRHMRLVDGRSNDFLVLPDGRRVYSAALLALAHTTRGLAEYMVRQDESGTITVHLVPDDRPDTSFDRLVAEFRRRFAETVTARAPLRFVRADRLELTTGGKARFIESRYRPDPDG